MMRFSCCQTKCWRPMPVVIDIVSTQCTEYEGIPPSSMEPEDGQVSSIDSAGNLGPLMFDAMTEGYDCLSLNRWSSLGAVAVIFTRKLTLSDCLIRAPYLSSTKSMSLKHQLITWASFCSRLFQKQPSREVIALAWKCRKESVGLVG